MTAAQISELVSVIVTITGLAAVIWRQAIVVSRVTRQRDEARRAAEHQRARAESLAARRP